MDIRALPALSDLDFASGPGLAPGHDALLLARWVALRPGERVLDLGTGQGIIALMLAARERVCVVGLEREAEVLAVARRNEARNRTLLKGAVCWVRGDLRHLPWGSGKRDIEGRPFDLVVLNPPYRVARSGRLPEDGARAAARFELHGSLGDWVAASAASLRPGGRVAGVHLPEREEEVCAALRQAGFDAVRGESVKPEGGQGRGWILVEGIRSRE